MGKKPASHRDRKDEAIPRKRIGNRRDVFAVLLIVVSVCIVYANAIDGTWALDDVVVNRPVSIEDIRDIIGFRKVAYITFQLNQFIAPFSPASFRAVNILIHICNSLLVYLLAYLTLQSVVRGRKDTGAHERTGPVGRQTTSLDNVVFGGALLSGIVFALHPLNVNAVTYIVQRMAALATFFVLLSLLCFIAASRSMTSASKVSWYMLGGVLIVAGIFSKENAVIAVPLILLYDYVFISHFAWSAFRKRLLVTAGIGLAALGPAAYFLGLHTSVIDLTNVFLNPNQPITEHGWTAVDVYWTPLQHVMTAFRVVSRYLFLIIVPLPQFLVFDWWGFPVSQGLTEPVTTLISLVLLLSLLVSAVLLRTRYTLACFGILWYLVAISIESFAALGSDLYFEHRNYLPLAGLVIGVCGQIVFTMRMRNDKRIWSTAVTICLVLGSLTFLRNGVWKDSLTLWGDTAMKRPENIRAVLSLANASMSLWDIRDAERYYRQVIGLSSRQKRVRFLNDAVYGLGMIYLFEGRMGDAKELIDKTESTIDSYKPEILRAFYLSLTDDFEGAMALFRDVLVKTQGIDTVVVLTLMGDTSRKKGAWDDAIRQYERAVSSDPSFSAAYYGLGVCSMAKRDVARAEEYFKKTLSLDPNNVLALSDMAEVLLIKRSDPRDALRLAEKAVSIPTPFYQPHASLGNVYMILGNELGADEQFRLAVKKGMEQYLVPFSKARIAYLKGDMERFYVYVAELKQYRNLPPKVRALLGDAEHR